MTLSDRARRVDGGTIISQRTKRIQAISLKLRENHAHGLDGGKFGWYAARTTGIGLQFGYNKERTQVIVLRPQKRSDVYKRASELAKTDEEKKLYNDIAKDAKKQEKKDGVKK